MTDAADTRYVSLREFARRAGVAPSTASDAVKTGRIPRECVSEDGKIDADAALRVWRPQAKGSRAARGRSEARSEGRSAAASEHPQRDGWTVYPADALSADELVDALAAASGPRASKGGSIPARGSRERQRKDQEADGDATAVAQTLAALLGVDDVGLAAALLGVTEGEAKALKETALAGTRVLELRKARGDLLSLAGLAKVLGEQARVARDMLRDIPPRLASVVASLEDPAEIERLLQDEIDAALEATALAVNEVAERVRRAA